MSDQSLTIVSIGSNTSDRAAIVDRALVRLNAVCHVVERTTVYECPDESGIGAPYYNVLVIVDPSTQSLTAIRDTFKLIERDLGRNKKSKPSGIMPIDMDIVVWRGTIVDQRQYSTHYFQTGLNLLHQNPPQ